MKIFTQFLQFLMDIVKSQRLIVELTKNDFQARYLGSYLGILWAFIQPVVTVFVFWFVFQVGFKAVPVANFPFILWLVAGLFPWFFIMDGISSGTTVIIENSYLVKKVVFRVSILPIIKILSALFIHLFFILLLFGMYAFYGHTPTIYAVQLLYYLFASFILLVGISWITSTLVIFLRDVGQIVPMLLQFTFWMTPIFWSLELVPAEYRYLFQLNPVYYIVDGYRQSLIYHTWFWENWELMISFWLITLILFVIGAVLFKKLRPHFADVL